MKKILLLSTLAAALWASTNVFAAKADGAKAKALAKYDTNKNGKLDAEEYAAVRKDFAEHPKGDLARLDTNSDGTLSDEELAAFSAGSGKKGKSDADKAEKRAKRTEKK